MRAIVGFALGAATAHGATLLDQKNRPVTKVINLLKDMSANLVKEGEHDTEVYNKIACWCTTNDKEKTQSIKEAEEHISQLTANIEEYTATSARLNTEIDNLEKEISTAQQALDEATEMRKKDLAEFNADEKDNLQSISAMKSAITVLSKHHKEPAMLSQISNLIKFNVMKKNIDLLPSQRKALDSFLQQPDDYFDAAPTFKQSYAPQSGEIFGILRNMLDTFNANLEQSQKDEMNAQKAYEQLKEAKENEIAEMTDHVTKKTAERADADENNVNAKEDLSDTRDSLSADQKFLMELKEKCQMTDQEFEQRQKTRQEEIAAVSEALGFLTSDDAHDLFSRTFNPASFIQTASDESMRRNSAAKVLSAAGARLSKPALSALATQVRLDAFVRVKKAIDEMVTKLLKEKEDEIKHKDFCVEELNENDKGEQLKKQQRDTLQSTIDQLTNDIKTLANEIETLNSEVDELNVQLKRAGEDREKENANFQATVADQRATQQILKKTLDVLKGFYAKKHKGVGLMQQEPAGPPPPPGFKTYKKQEGAGGVLGLITQIINDAKIMETEAVTAEKDAQTAYETYVKDTNDSITDKRASVVDKTSVKAKKEKTKADKELDLDNTMTEIEQLDNEAQALHKACDFVLKNFDARQTARDQEVEALRNAKAILSGADFKAFLQRRD